MTSFSELGIGKRLCASIREIGWTEPTPIQREAVPEGMAGRDLFGQAQTGTGKTGAYSMIVLGRTRAGGGGPTTVVMTPTRELAAQVAREMGGLARETRHSIVAAYGGASMAEQVRRISEGCDVVVGTPGRILDLHRRGILDMSSVKELVIDEADRMLDMGFIDEMREIISLTPATRQTLMFSATLSDEVRAVASESMRDPVEVSVSGDEPATDLVEQYYVETARKGKTDLLRDIMAAGDPKMIVFCSTKGMVDDLYSGLSEEGLKVGAIHGDMPQSRRERTIRGFRNDRMSILIATDVAARGLDIDNVECVVNWDAPLDPETYTHRIGRAGRAGRKGYAVTFITPQEDRRIPSYEAFTGRTVTRLSRKQLQRMSLSNPELRRTRAPREEGKPKVSATIRKQRPAPPEHMTVIALDVGKSAGIHRDDVTGFMASCGAPADRLGRIGMGSDSCFVEVDSAIADDVIRSANGGRLGGRRVRAGPAPEKTRHKEGSGTASRRP